MVMRMMMCKLRRESHTCKPEAFLSAPTYPPTHVVFAGAKERRRQTLAGGTVMVLCCGCFLTRGTPGSILADPQSFSHPVSAKDGSLSLTHVWLWVADIHGQRTGLNPIPCFTSFAVATSGGPWCRHMPGPMGCSRPSAHVCLQGDYDLGSYAGPS